MKSILVSPVVYEMLQELSKKQNKRQDFIIEALVKDAYSRQK